jgi:hypothetical protein
VFWKHTLHLAGHYDSFNVVDSSPLKVAISLVNPGAALKMKEALHMTVSYPSFWKVSGLNEAATIVFANVTDVPAVHLHVTEIFACIHPVADGLPPQWSLQSTLP